jgi:hypothetical protein
MNTLYHINVVRAAFKDYLSPTSIDRVLRYNFNTDFYGSPGWKIMEHKVFPLYPLARHWYFRFDHFDQLDGPDAIIETWHMHKNRIMDLIDNSKYPPKKLGPIFRILGRSSHALTDIPSHTNFVHLLYEYLQEDPAARKMVEASGKKLGEYIGEFGPTFGYILTAPEYSGFREKYIPRLLSFISIPDSGPTSHSECGIDSPNSPACKKDSRQELFNVALNLSMREVIDVIREFFERLRIENSEKFRILTEAFRDSGMAPDEPGKYARRARFWATKVGGWD